MSMYGGHLYQHTIGLRWVSRQKATKLTIDTHLMIEEPNVRRKFGEAGVTWFGFC